MEAPFIDTHCHIWQLARGDYGWLTEDLTLLYQDYINVLFVWCPHKVIARMAVEILLCRVGL